MNKKIFSKFLVLALAVGIFGVVTVTNVLGASAPETQTTINNVAPTFTTNTTESWTQTYTGNGGVNTTAHTESSITYPTNMGTTLTFSATANDTNSDNYYLLVCETAGATANNEAAPSCTVGPQICVSSSTASDAEATCTKSTAGLSNETYNWYSYVCDHNGASSCSAASTTSQGGSADESNANPTGSPYHVNHIPTFTAGTIFDSADGSIAPGDVVKFVNSADADTDTTTTADTINYYVCSGEADQGGVTTAFDFYNNTCTGGSLLCYQTGVNPGAVNATCNDDPTGAGLADVHTNIVSVPTAHATDYTVKIYVEDSHDFDAALESKDYTVIDVAPVWTSYNTSGAYVFQAGGYNTVNRTVTYTDDNGDRDTTTLEMVWFEDQEVDDNCTDNERNCYELTSIDVVSLLDSAPTAPTEGCYTSTVSAAGTGKTATGSDASVTVTCDYAVYFNASCGTTCDADGEATNNWEMSVTATDGTGDTNFADSNDNNIVPASTGIGIAEATIAYGIVALDTDSDSDITTMQNLGNQIIDVLLNGTNMELATYVGSDCAADTDCIVAAQQKFHENNVVNFDWTTGGGVALISTAPEAGSDAAGCLNRDMAVRAVAATGTEDEIISWVIHIPAVQQSGAYTGTNTFAATAEANDDCSGGPF
ncbi:MAG: hypothetical protein ABIG80_04545 [Patescibacteria group bacterium]